MMSICNRLSPVVALSILGTSLGAAACFDVNRVEVSSQAPLLLDDFEDGDQVPRSDRFTPWYCYAFRSDVPEPTCQGVAPGFHSQGAEALTFELNVPLDMQQAGSVGAGIGLSTLSPVPFDLNAWHTLRFDAKFESRDPSSSAKSSLAVRVKCPATAPPGSALDPASVWVEQHFDVGSEWSSLAAPLDAFQQPPFVPVSIHVPDCGAQARSLVFEIPLTDDRSGIVTGGSGTLTLDNLVLE
jgi:hypothetical protein